MLVVSHSLLIKMAGWALMAHIRLLCHSNKHFGYLVIALLIPNNRQPDKGRSWWRIQWRYRLVAMGNSIFIIIGKLQYTVNLRRFSTQPRQTISIGHVPVFITMARCMCSGVTSRYYRRSGRLISKPLVRWWRRLGRLWLKQLINGRSKFKS